MSWNPFNRHNQPRKSIVSKTATREFEREVTRIEDLDEAVKKLSKDMKKCTDAFSTMSKTEVKIAQDLATGNLCLHCGEDHLKADMDQWGHALTKLDQHTQDLNSVAQKTVMDPMKKLGSVFPSLQAAVKKREQSLQECNKCQARVEKYQDRERTGSNIAKLDQSKKALQTAKEEFETQNKLLQEDLPTFYEGRIGYIEPCFQALVLSQAHHIGEARKIYSEIYDSLTQQQDLLITDDDDVIQSKLAEIRALSIVVE
ncbi:bridging integrator 3-like [Lineus longissimus]|uniref:bridging integrator 3-like n=1 Tax=Lineus longissimus TaxID=88925 RepID=UPI002B4EB161